MRVTYEIPPDVVSAVEGRSGAAHVTADEYVAERLRESVSFPSVRTRVDIYVAAGFCDADIAAMMHYTPGRIASIRRSLGLKPNPRYRRGA